MPHEAALIEWSARRSAQATAAKIEAKQAEAQKSEHEKAIAKQNQAIADKFAARVAKFEKDHPDYRDVVERDDVPASMPMQHAMLNSEDGPAMAYYLGQNPDEAERISKLDGINAVYEMGKISARLAEKPRASTKPAPITPLKTGSASANRKAPSEMSMEEYAAMRSPQLAAERKPFIGNGVARPARPH